LFVTINVVKTLKGKVNLHTKKLLPNGIVALLLLSMVMLTTPASAKPIPPGFEYTVYTKPPTVNGSAVGLGNTFVVELWANTSLFGGGPPPGCYAYAYWFQWNDTLLNLTSWSVFPPVDKWTLGIFTGDDSLKDIDINGKKDTHSYGVSALQVPAAWMDNRKIANYTFKVMYQPAYPEPTMSCNLHIVDKGFADVNGANRPPGDLEDGTYEIFPIPGLTVTVSADPTTVYSGETSAITVSVTSEGTPVSGATVTLSSDPPDGFSSVVDQGDGNYTSVFTAPIVSTPTVVNITAEASKAGYVTGEGSTNVTVNPDITPPTILISSPQNTTYTVSSVSLTFTLSESTSWIGYSLDDQANVTITGSTTLTGLLDGSHHVVVYANDTSGNMGASGTVYFTIIDVTPPTISILSPENKTYATSDVLLSFTVDESTSWIGYSLDDQANVTITGSTTLTGLLDGSHHVVVYANDTSGNMGASGTVYFTIIDVTPPTISILSPENKTYATSDVLLSFTVDESTSWIGYSLDDQANVTITGSTTLTGLLDGSHHVVVYANDTSGNMGASTTVYFTVADTTPPNITDVSQTPLANNVQPVDVVEIQATVTDDLSGVKKVTLNYTNGNGTWIIVAMTNIEGNIWNATIPAFPYCTNVTYIIMAEDNANNTITTEELGQSYEYHVIPEFPSATIMTLLMTIASMLAVVLAKKKLPRKTKT